MTSQAAIYNFEDAPRSRFTLRNSPRAPTASTFFYHRYLHHCLYRTLIIHFANKLLASAFAFTRPTSRLAARCFTKSATTRVESHFTQQPHYLLSQYIDSKARRPWPFIKMSDSEDDRPLVQGTRSLGKSFESSDSDEVKPLSWVGLSQIFTCLTRSTTFPFNHITANLCLTSSPRTIHSPSFTHCQLVTRLYFG